MDPFFLTFSNPALEERYLMHTTHVTALKLDAGFWWFTVLSRGAILFKGEQPLLWPTYAYLAWLAGEALLRRRIAASRLWQWRDSLVIMSRLLHTFEFGRTSKETLALMLDLAELQAPYKSVVISAIFLGMVPMTFLGLFQPLRFKMHLPIHLLSSAFIMATANLQVCRLSNAIGYAGTGWLIDKMDFVARSIVGAALATDVSDDPLWKVEFPCLQQALFLQMYLGFGAVTYAVWLFEHRSRVAFIESLPFEDRPTQCVSELVWSTIFMHAMILLVAFGVFWRVFLSFAPGLINWGMCGGLLSARPATEVCSRLGVD